MLEQQIELYHWVFVWNSDQKPADVTLRQLSDISRPVRYINVGSLQEAITVYNFAGATCAQVWHTASVPRNALEYFGGGVIDGIKK